MNDSLGRGETARSRRLSAAAELGANVSPQDGEVNEVHPRTESQTGPDRLAVAGVRMERSNSLTQVVHQRHMPKEPLKFHIPRKTKENRALFQYVSTESREYEDMLTILTSSYIDTTSAGCFTYCQPRLVHSDQLEKEFVEKRKEMKADGRTDKELEESYCFLLAESVKLHPLCEKGLFVGHSWITVLGNPRKGVYLSRYSDLLQINALTPGATGEILIFKVMKGKVKSIYENMKNLLDPTPRFDSHISKNACKVTSLNSYRAFELTQQYFYEYSFDELLPRPRQVCPHAVVSFHFKGRDSSLPSKPLAPVRLNSQSAEASKERAQYTVWTGELVKGDRVLYNISVCSFSPPFLPHKLPEKLEIGSPIRLDQVTKLVPSELFSYNLYNGSQEVVANGYYCSLLEVIDRSRSTTSVTRLLQELEIKRVVLVTPLTEKGFLFLLSSVQMATPTERGDNWKRCLQALFVFPESRDVAKSTPKVVPSSCDAPHASMSGVPIMPQLNRFIPALHHSLIKARANPSPELSAGVEQQVREYFMGLNDGKVRHYPMGEYDSKLDEQGKMSPAPRHHRVNMDGYLRSYLYSPTLYLLSVPCIRQLMETHCSTEQPQEVRLRGQIKATGKDVTINTRGGQTKTQEIQQLIDLVLTCKRNAENEVHREEGVLKTPGRKRRLEQETAQRTLKFLKASQGPERRKMNPVEESQVSASPGSLESVISSVGLKDMDLREDGSELAARLLSLLTGLSQAASGTACRRLSEGQEDGQRDSSPFDTLATKLGLPTNCDIDLRRQEELEDQTAGSISSLEGFSPSSHSGETHYQGAKGGGQGKRTGAYEEEDEAEEWQIPWVLIPITGLCSERYTHRDRNIPQDPRFQHLATATTITTATKPTRGSPTQSHVPSSSSSPFQCPSPDPCTPPSPSQCPSPDPSPPPSPSQCPSPEPSPPPSPSQVLSPESSPPTSSSKDPSLQTSPPTSSSQALSPPFGSQCQSPKPNELDRPNKGHSGANEEQLTVSREFTVVPVDRKEKEKKQPSIPASVSPLMEPGKENAAGKAREMDVVKRRLGGGGEVAKPNADMAKEATKHDAVEVVDLHEMASKKEQKDQVKDVEVGSLLPSSASSHYAVEGINSIVDKHLGDFSSEIQLLLQEQNIHYNLPQSPHSTSTTETTQDQKKLPHASISPFSQYVSFYNPCPPIQNYVHSMQSSINSMLTELERWPSHNADPTQNDADTVLASSVSAFVAGIRAGNATTEEDENVPASSELMTGDVSASVIQPHNIPDGTNNRNSKTSHVTLPVPASSPACQSPKLHPPPINSLQLHWQPPQNPTSNISRTVSQNVRQPQDNNTFRTLDCTAGVEAGSTTAGSNKVTSPRFNNVLKNLTEPSLSSEPVSSSASVPPSENGASLVPPATALSSLISQLQPEVFSSLVEIIKDVKRNTLQFYLHSTEPDDPFYEDITELLLKQGNTELNPVAFLSQENTDNRLLVIIRNKDISGHIHKIPGLMSLKRHPSVVFVGIDNLDDIRNNSYIELFVSGGCIVSDELVLNPDFITQDRLAELLKFLEHHSSPDSVWKWKVHCKTQKKLKEQARFRKDAANLLEVLSTYQKRQIVEFLPYHRCDMMNQQSPDLDCLVELQGRYTQYRHTVFLTELHFEKFAAYSGSGIIVAGIEEILQDFTRLVGYHDIKEKQPIMNDLLSPKGLGRHLSHSDSLTGSERSPSIFPEHIHPLSSYEESQQPGSCPSSLPHVPDQLVPDASSKDTVSEHSHTDFEALRQAISHLRAERQAQLQQQQQLLDSQTDRILNPTKKSSSPVGPNEPVELTRGKKAVAATLELIHSAIHPEPVDQEKGKSSMTPSTERQKKAAPEEAEGAGQSNQPDSTSDRTEKVDQRGEHAASKTSNLTAASSSSANLPLDGSRPRDTHSVQEQLSGSDRVTPGSTTGGNKLTGSATVTSQGLNTNASLSCLQPVQQQLNKQQQHLPPRHSHQQPPHQQQWGVGLLQPPHLARHPNQPFSSGHMLGPLTTLRGIRSIFGPTPVWTGGLPPTGPPPFMWGIPQHGTGASLLGGYHNPAGQGSSRYRGGQRGGGFNGM